MSDALWHWALEPGKDYWITLRDWMLYLARQPHPVFMQYPELFSKPLKIGAKLRIKLPENYHVAG